MALRVPHYMAILYTIPQNRVLINIISRPLLPYSTGFLHFLFVAEVAGSQGSHVGFIGLKACIVEVQGSLRYLFVHMLGAAPIQ